MSYRHGLSTHPAYTRWANMVARCTNPRRPDYVYYGGRGITVCTQWLKFTGFWADMQQGYAPGLTLDRRDNSAGYSPENCRWVTLTQNARNKRNNHWIDTPRGRMTIPEAAEVFHLTKDTIYNRVYRRQTPIK